MTGYGRLRTATCILAFALLATACDEGFGDGVTDTNGGAIASIAVTPGLVSLDGIGDTQQLSAQAVDQQGNDVSATFQWTSSAPGVASVSSSGLVTAEALGTARITAAAGGVTSNEVTVSVEEASAECTTLDDFIVGSINVGQSISGELTTSDCLDGDWYTQLLELELTSATTLQIDLESGDFNAYLLLLDASGASIVEDDDSGTGTNAHITRSLDAGTYFVGASTAGAFETGSYTLTVAEGGSTTDCSSIGDYLVGSIALNTSESGSLETGDCQLDDGTFAEAWEMTLSSSTTIQIDLESADFDAYLLVTDDSGSLVGEDDDGGTGTNSRVSTTLSAGTYYIFANTFEAGESGAYTLTLIN